MMLLMGFFIVSFFVVVFVLMVYVLSYYCVNSVYSKTSGFECGFSNFVGNVVSFSIPFFSVSLMFLLFDVEIILLSFFPIQGQFFYNFWVVVVLVILSTCYEWYCGVLSWFSSFFDEFRPC